MQRLQAERAKRRGHLDFQVCGKAPRSLKDEHTEGRGKERLFAGASFMRKGTEVKNSVSGLAAALAGRAAMRAQAGEAGGPEPRGSHSLTPGSDLSSLVGEKR